ncbi:MAG: hypothetical protein F4151_10855 [Gammaproteobacteria bacterium]|nr:hypothetical protein [Gammaproteobacteria bacterium]
MLRRSGTSLVLAGVALLSMGAAPAPEEERAMLEAFDQALTAMAYAAGGLAVFAIAWAGVVLMAEGAEGRGGRAKSAVVMAVVGLVIVLSAKGIALALRNGLIPAL